MPHHKQYVRSLRKDAKRRTENRAGRARLRHAIRELRSETDAKKAAAMLSRVTALLDKAAKTRLVHPGTADRMKSRLALAVGRLQKRAA